MKRDIRAIVEIKKSCEIFNLIILVGAAVLMTVIALITSANVGLDREEMRFMILFGVGGAYIGGNAFFKLFFMADEVPRALTFGMTRKKLFIGSRIADLLETLVVTVIALIVIHELEAIVILKIAAILFGIFMWIEGLAGNNVIRYGKVVYWIYYIVFMVVCLGLPRMTEIFPGSGAPFMKMIDYLTNPFFNQGAVWSVILGFILVGMIINWITFRKLAVNYTV